MSLTAHAHRLYCYKASLTIGKGTDFTAYQLADIEFPTFVVWRVRRSNKAIHAGILDGFDRSPDIYSLIEKLDVHLHS